METIIAGRFDTYPQAQQAARALQDKSFAAQDMCMFSVNPPGQHGSYPVGGDRDADPQSADMPKGAAKGAAAGAAAAGVAGVAAAAAAPAAAAALIGAAVAAGAYTGSLVGAASEAPEKGEQPDSAPDQHEAPPAQRQGGVLLAVRVDGAEPATQAAQLLFAQGAHEVEEAQGTWRDGSWADFDPVTPPRLLDPRMHAGS